MSRTRTRFRMNLARTVECPETQPENSAGLTGDLHRCMQVIGQFPRSAQSIFACLNIPAQSIFACVNILVQRNKGTTICIHLISLE